MNFRKNFLKFSKTLIVLVLLLSTHSKSFAFGTGDWSVYREGNCNGSIELKIIRHNGGNKIDHHLIIQYQNEVFKWITIGAIFHFMDDGNKYVGYGYNNAWLQNGTKTTSEYWYKLTWKPPSKLRNKGITFRTMESASITGYDTEQSLANARIPESVIDGVVNTFITGGGKKTATAYQPEAPTNVQATINDGCNNIKITWDKPGNLSTYTDYYYNVYRDGSFIKNNGKSTTYDYNPPVEGQDYKFKVQLILTCTSGSNYSELSMEASGKSYGPLDPPTNIQATNEDCNGKVKITWQWNSSSPESFRLQRSTSSNFSNITYITVDKDARNHEDKPPTANTVYYYRLQTENRCNVYSVNSKTTKGQHLSIPPAPSNLVASIIGSGIHLTWTDNSNNEDGFIIIRTLKKTGSTLETPIAEGITSFDDTEIENCQLYKYEVKAKNGCGISASDVTEIILKSDLSISFAGGFFKVSKGYYSDKIQLEWENDNGNIIDHFKIYRKIKGSANNPVLIHTALSIAAIYNDPTAEAGIIYEYSIFGEGDCGGIANQTDTVYDLGFRTPSGIVNGQISYEGGVAVAGVDVLVEKASGQTGSAIKFNGSSYITVPHSDKLMDTTALTLEAWIRPTNLDNDFDIITKSKNGSGYKLAYVNASNSIQFLVKGQNLDYDLTVADSLSINTYTNIVATFDSDSMVIYINGIKANKILTGSAIKANTADLVIGAKNNKSGNYFTGNLDEIIIWRKSRTSINIERDYNRILSGQESDISAYWRADENTGNNIFDASKTGVVFNENHGAFTGVTWSNIIPTNAQLGLKGITDENGNYIINNIRYTGTGNNFTLTPSFGQHTFDPGNRVLYIGENSSVHNNQDFTDVSSFKVTGTVKFKNTTCFAQDVYLKIDGEQVIKLGEAIKTDNKGFFTISVPIGFHTISIEKQGHVFNVGQWPTNGSKHDFQQPISGIEFEDNTLVTMIGRVVGGTREGNKKPGLGRSKNNIGVAEIIFESQQGPGCSSITTTTDSASGEYSVALPPMIFTVKSLIIPSDLGKVFTDLEVVDLSKTRLLEWSTDSVFKSDGTLNKIDSASYNYRNDYIRRSAPELSVTNKNGTAFSGDTVTTYTDNKTDTESEIKTTSYPYPVFTEDGRYTAKISVYERYVNNDKPTDITEDRVPVSDGVITINNSLGKSGGTAEVINLTGGDTLYKFTGGKPNMLLNTSKPAHSYTKTMQIVVEIGSEAASWEPGPIGDEFYRAYLFGSNSVGKSFATEGPQVVNRILRDPPGSNSYSYIEEGATTATSSSWQADFGSEFYLDKVIKLGTKFSVGLGFQTETEIQNSIKLGFKAEFNGTEGKEINETFTTTKRWQTSDGPELPGALSDLFVGKANNFIYGISENLGLLPDSVCDLAGIECSGVSNNGYQIGKRYGMWAVPGGYETMFIYSQDHIINYLIPDLEELRNALFANNSKYTSKLTAGEENYGSNNDDAVWGANKTSDDPLKTVEADYDGSSYTFTWDKTKPGQDTVRWYNQQIRLWEEALARNEEEKIAAENFRNISFEAGQPYNYEYKSTHDTTWSHSFEFVAEESFAYDIGAKIGGFGFNSTNSLKLHQNYTDGWGNSEENSTAYGFELMDNNQGDFFSVDVNDPKSNNGPVFKLKGGQTMCPWEGPVLSQYASTKNIVLSEGTLKREKPSLSITPFNLKNVPEDEAGVFTLTLGNESESKETQWYSLRVLETSNPDGAVVRIDGSAINRIYTVPGNGEINKSLTLTKGPNANDYNDIKIIIYSTCEWDNFTNGGSLIAVDTVSLSISFVPACSDVDFIIPKDQWVANYSNDDTLSVVINDYDLYYSDFEKIQFQYKSANSSTWIGLQSFYTDTTGLNNPDAVEIPDVQPYFTYHWDISQIIDGPYDIKAITQCPLAKDQSPILSGIVDRVNPHPFGTPQPADGILSPNDEIMIQFNETIDAAQLTWDNFDIRGVLNGTEVSHSASIAFDGNNDYVSIPDGVNLSNKSFTIELWAKRAGSGAEILFSQGSTGSEAMRIGFNASDYLVWNIGAEALVSIDPMLDQKWHHYAFTYNTVTKAAQVFIDGGLSKNKGLTKSYDVLGPVVLGKQSYGDPSWYAGNIHELRIWSTTRQQGELVSNMNLQLNGNEIGLLGNWPMDEAFGTLLEDRVHGRNATSYSEWEIYPKGSGLALDGVSYTDFESSAAVAFTDETDMTIEFWLKSANGANIGLVSNGKGNGTDSNTVGWSIETDAVGRIKVLNNNVAFLATSTSIFDNNWHHFALVVDRLGNTNALVDGQITGSISSEQWSGFGGPKLCLGARSWYTGSVEKHDKYFNGILDEFRIWNVARKTDQIKRDMNSRLTGDEVGIVAYFPFEHYKNDAGVNVLTPSLDEQTSTGLSLTSYNNAAISNTTANIKLARPVQKVNYTYSINDDKIILTPTDAGYLLENCILDISVLDVHDMNGNKMVSAATWSAYVNKNQVKWGETILSFEKDLYMPLSFTAIVINSGGNQQGFSIENLPNWLTAQPQNGTIEPNSEVEVNFTVNSGVNLGNYTQDIYLQTSFGFEEQLLLELRVTEKAPDWEVDPSDFTYSMNVIGELSFNDVLSTDGLDKVAAFVNGQCRGVADLKYILEYDRYEVFLNIYSNDTADNIYFYAWDASKGTIQTDVTPTYKFESNKIYGTPGIPIRLNASDVIMRSIIMESGWNWISFNLDAVDLNNKTLLKDLNTTDGDFVTSITPFEQYSDANGWNGSLFAAGGFDYKSLYKFRTNNADTLTYQGPVIDPTTIDINLVTGWNWIGYLPQFNISVKEALSSLNPQSGDLLKGQHTFAMYDDNIGWLGSLKYLKPTEGYMLKTSQPGTLTYPEKGTLSRKKEEEALLSNLPKSWNAKLNTYRNNMTLTAVLKSDVDLQLNQGDFIGAFVNGELRGFGKATSIASNKYFFFITIESNVDDENITFKYWNSSLNGEANIIENFAFSNNLHRGSLQTPVILNIKADDANAVSLVQRNDFISAHPNPFTNAIQINLNLKENEILRVEVVNVIGEVVSVLADNMFNSGETQLTWQSKNLPAGTYYIRIVGKQTNEIHKIIKTN